MKYKTLIILFAIALAVSVTAFRMDSDNHLIHKGIVEASVDDVWAAFTTKEGLESWMAAHAEIELKVGGKMSTLYDPKGKIGDPKTIENTILSFDPKRMLSIKVSKAPEGFPFPNAVKNMWTVIYFEKKDSRKTRVTEIDLGFGIDEESKKMREFFNRGNALTLQQLQKRFAPKMPKE